MSMGKLFQMWGAFTKKENLKQLIREWDNRREK